jgi:hypothetical protein
MNVELTKHQIVGGSVYYTGTVLDLDEKKAQELIEKGLAKAASPAGSPPSGRGKSVKPAAAEDSGETAGAPEEGDPREKQNGS